VSVEEIQGRIRDGDYRYSDHSLKMMIKRSIFRLEVESAILKGKVIERYPDDKYSPSCLIYGKTENGRDLHIQISMPPEVVVVTVYEPELDKWLDCKKRR